MHSRFKFRSNEKELLDEVNIDSGLLNENLRELDILNRISGGHSLSLFGIKQLIKDHDKLYHIVDLGCGSGDALKYIADWARINKYGLRLTGVDMNPGAIEYLEKHCSDYPEIKGVVADYQDYLNKTPGIDIVHASLFCHHLNDAQLSDLFLYFRQKLNVGFIINDLYRHWIAYYSAWLFTRLFNGTELSKNDGPVSVLRSFKSSELIMLLDKAGIINYSIHRKRLFRLIIVGNLENYEAVTRFQS
ncbi:MAG: methyltransferase domain-containing protein [Bacteroidetes bacterium]|nr:methyltransferase domain-containing protein [Bacteroidota bacterium]